MMNITLVHVATRQNPIVNRLNKTKNVKNMEDTDLEAERTEHMKELAKAKRLIAEAEVC